MIGQLCRGTVSTPRAAPELALLPRAALPGLSTTRLCLTRPSAHGRLWGSIAVSSSWLP